MTGVIELSELGRTTANWVHFSASGGEADISRLPVSLTNLRTNNTLLSPSIPSSYLHSNSLFAFSLRVTHSQTFTDPTVEQVNTASLSTIDEVAHSALFQSWHKSFPLNSQSCFKYVHLPSQLQRSS